jgi:hypothetical protein
VFRRPGTTLSYRAFAHFVAGVTEVVRGVVGASLVGVRTCDFCGRQADDAETMTWTTSVENGRKRVYCDTCSREHLRAMESKLDSEWW